MSDALTVLENKLELLKEVHTQEDLDRVKAEVEKAKIRALSESTEYRQLLEERRRDAETRAEKIRREYDSKISDVKLRADAAISKAEDAKTQAERMRARLMPGITGKELPSPETGLACPKCGNTLLNWMVKGKGKHKKTMPWCSRCDVTMTVKGEKRYVRTLKPGEALKDELKRIRGS